MISNIVIIYSDTLKYTHTYKRVCREQYRNIEYIYNLEFHITVSIVRYWRIVDFWDEINFNKRDI